MKNHSLEALYLDPLEKRVNVNKYAGVYKTEKTAPRPFALMINLHNATNTTMDQLESVLRYVVCVMRALM